MRAEVAFEIYQSLSDKEKERFRMMTGGEAQPPSQIKEDSMEYLLKKLTRKQARVKRSA